MVSFVLFIMAAWMFVLLLHIHELEKTTVKVRPQRDLNYELGEKFRKESGTRYN